MSQSIDLRARAEGLAQALPPLLAEAEHLAATVILGEHGRRRAGMGDDFWQYRPAHAGDTARAIDWRRSARSDAHFVREHEWQAAQSVSLWVDRGASMRFASKKGLPEKADRARLLALALAILLLRAGERVGLAHAPADPADAIAPRAGRHQAALLAEALAMRQSVEDYAPPVTAGVEPRSLVVLLSDFLGEIGPIHAALQEISGRGARALIVQVLDPAEEEFPFAGRVVFESMGGSLKHETKQAGDLRERYRLRLAERQDELGRLARHAGGRFHVLHTDAPPAEGLQWLLPRGGRGAALMAGLGFEAPLILIVLVALPILWLVLRAIPPAPILRRFPGVALLLGLADRDSTSDRTPWWLLLLGCWRWARRSSALPGR